MRNKNFYARMFWKGAFSQRNTKGGGFKWRFLYFRLFFFGGGKISKNGFKPPPRRDV